MDNVVALVIYLMVALVMAGIGIVQIRGKNPTGFYTGEEPPKKEELTDWKAWNRRHGTMWLIYSAAIMLGALVGAMMGDTVYSVIPMCAGVIVPLPIMIWYHHRLIKKYRK